MRKLCFLLTFVFVSIQLGGCSATFSKPTEQDTIAIYQTVIKQIYQHDDTFGGTLEKPTLYIIRATDDPVGDPSLRQSNSVVISATVQLSVTSAFANLPTTMIWVDSSDQVSLDPDTGLVSDEGVIITLGNIKYKNNGKALVAASIYVARLAAGGKTYILEKKDGIWTITGTTGVEWIS